MTEDPTPLNLTANADARTLALFDQYSRYASAAEAIRASAAGEPIEVLDVGSGQARLLGVFLPEARVTYLDPLLVGQEQEVDVLPGTFEQLEGMDRTWSWTVAVDTLEHVPPELRQRFVDTMVARARDGVVISAPFSEDEAAIQVDDLVNEAYRLKNGVDYSWLIEHQTYGLPSLATTEAQFHSAGLHTATFGNGHTPWLEALLPLFVCFLDRPESLSLMQEISQLFNQRLFRFDHFAPVYRRILVGRVGASPQSPEFIADDPAGRQEAEATWRLFMAEVTGMVAAYAEDLTDRLQLGEAERATVVGALALAQQRVDELVQRCEQTELAAQEQGERLAAVTRDCADASRQAAGLETEIQRIRGSVTWRFAAMVWRLAWPLRALLGRQAKSDSTTPR